MRLLSSFDSKTAAFFLALPARLGSGRRVKGSLRSTRSAEYVWVVRRFLAFRACKMERATPTERLRALSAESARLAAPIGPKTTCLWLGKAKRFALATEDDKTVLRACKNVVLLRAEVSLREVAKTAV